LAHHSGSAPEGKKKSPVIPVEERLTQPAIPKPRKANCDLKIKQLEDVRKMGFCQGNGHEIIGFMAGGNFRGIFFFGKMWMMSTWVFPFQAGTKTSEHFRTARKSAQRFHHVL
jgi:hypothetical protein